MEQEKSKEEILAKFEKKDDKYIYKLKESVKFGEETILEFSLFTPKAKHIRDMPSKPKMSDILDIIGKLSAQPKVVIDNLAIEDVNALAEYFSAFN